MNTDIWLIFSSEIFSAMLGMTEWIVIVYGGVVLIYELWRLASTRSKEKMCPSVVEGENMVFSVFQTRKVS